MKARIATLVLVGMVACSLAAVAQTNPPVAETDATSMTNNEAAPVTDTASAPAADTASAPADEAAAPAMETASNNVATATESTNAAGDTNAVIPLIVMDDVPLTDAIKNLARQAGMNYMLDPKLAYGQPGPDGKTIPQPYVSIRWENVTAGQALAALLSNYNLQLVQDPKTKIARITVRDPAAPDPLLTKVIQLQWANPSNVLSAVQAVLVEDKRSKVVADIRTSQLVVLATEKQLTAVDDLIQRLDTPTKQVLIEGTLLETSLNPTSVKGINWSGTLQAQKLAFGNNLQQNDPKDSINNTLVKQPFPKMLFDTAKGFNPATAFLDADGLSAVLSFINENSEAKVLSEPRTVTLDNEPAHISVTRASPIINVTPGTVQVAGGSQITYTNLGVILDVTPRISANDYVNLKVVPEVSRIFDTVTKVVANGEYQADEYDIRKLETSVMIPSGNTLVLGGLVQDDQRFSTTKVPILGDIPLIGGAFRSSSKSRQKANLLIFITPTIVKDSDYQPTKTDFLRNPLPQPDQSEWSTWDSTKPLDWSKPLISQYRSPKKPETVYQDANVQAPADQNSGPQEPVYQNADVQAPADQNSDSQEPVYQNTDVQAPADQNADSQEPVYQNVDVQAPADQNSDSQEPAH